MRHANTLDVSKAALAVIDLQEVFRPAILEFKEIVARSVVMVRGAALLGIPTLVTEQYPQKLGKPVPEIPTHRQPETRAWEQQESRRTGRQNSMQTDGEVSRVQAQLFFYTLHALYCGIVLLLQCRLSSSGDIA